MHPSLINILPEFQGLYLHHNTNGYNVSQTKTVAIIGLCRNLEHCLFQNLSKLENIASGFKDYQFFIYENDSEDNTVQILKQWENSKHQFKSEQLNVPKFNQSTTKQRIEVMAYGRNKCLEYVRNNLSNYDFVWVVDLDFINISVEGIYNTISWLEQTPHAYGVAGFSYHNRVQPLPEGLVTKHKMLTNYDSWAYRHTNWTDTYSLGLLYWFWWWIPLVGSPPFSVNSAFGGSSIYRTTQFLLGHYDTVDCEHVTFHHSIAQQSRHSLLVNPSQIMIV
jgi:hypothetical protein